VRGSFGHHRLQKDNQVLLIGEESSLSRWRRCFLVCIIVEYRTPLILFELVRVHKK
jgi:hypothetical protein